MAESTVGGSTAGVGGAGLFSRQSSGLVRDFSLADIAWYGVFSTGGAFGLVYLFPTPQFVSPGISIFLLILFSLIYAVVVYFVYAAMGSAMPRAGGDYLFESRSLHPAIGFVVPWACQLLFWLAFPASGAFVVTFFGLVPISEKAGWTGFENWLVGENGIFVVSAIVVLACWALTVFGLRVYRPLQRYVLVPGILIGAVTILVVELDQHQHRLRRKVRRLQRVLQNHHRHSYRCGDQGRIPRNILQFHPHGDLDGSAGRDHPLHHVRRPGAIG